MFNLDQNEGILRNIRTLRQAVDEIVVVDSSSVEQHEILVRLTREYSVRVYHVLPLGFPEPLRPFGLSKVKSDYVFMLDADEEASETLMSNLRHLRDCDAYVVPRFEEHLSSYTYQLRLFRREAIRNQRRSFDFPVVLGRVGWLEKTHRINHHADYESYLADQSRARRYFTIEIVERPFTRRYLEEGLTVRMRKRSISCSFVNMSHQDPDRPLSPVMVRWIIEFEFLRDLLLGKGRKAASFGRRYSLAKWEFFCTLPDLERRHFLAIARDVQLSGGVFEYLGLTDPAYLEKLTASFDWNLRGIDVYRRLLDYRYRVGSPSDCVPAK